jgi:hypothetical protein
MSSIRLIGIKTPRKPRTCPRRQTNCKKIGPEYLALLEATKDVDPNSKDGQEIVSIFDKLDSSCQD